MAASRNQTLDIAKGIGIMLVVLGHNWVTTRAQSELFRVIFSVHVPLFFYLSGIFLRPDETFCKFIAARFHALLKPYFVVLVAVGIVKFFGAQLFHIEEKFGVIQYLRGIAYGTGLTLFITERSTVWIALWFLPHLFLSSVVTWIVIRLVKSRLLILVYAIVSLSVGVRLLPLLLPLHGLAWSLDLVPVTSAFLAMGYLSGDALKTFEFKPRFFLLALFAFSILHYLFNETIDLNMRAYGSFFICTAQACLGIYLCLSAAAALVRFRRARQILSYVGSGSLFILIFHWVFQAYTFEALMNRSGNLFLACAVGFAAGILLPLALFEISKKNYWLSIMLLPKKLIHRA